MYTCHLIENDRSCIFSFVDTLFKNMSKMFSIKSYISDKKRIDQSHESIIQMRLVNSFSVQNLGAISNIADTKFK